MSHLVTARLCSWISPPSRSLRTCAITRAQSGPPILSPRLLGQPYQIRDTDGRPVSVDEAKAIIADRWTVPEDVRRRRRSLQTRAGKAPRQVVARHAKPSAELAGMRRPSPEPMVPEPPTPIKEVLPAIAERLGIPS